jgi:hydrogenase maturation protein HypF
MKTRWRARITGRVQGVGFRPTVYRYATALGLGGFVRNDPQGVTLEVEGDELKIGAFFNHLTNEPPRHAIIIDIQTEVLEATGCQQFDVVGSEDGGEAAALISPDLATCDDCLRELADPRDRRFGYPFINCTNCGPRFTIVRGLPYDRDKTSMAEFTLCEPCDREYHDPGDRRFHAQPNACPDCGPRVELRTPAGVSAVADPIVKAQDLLHRGGIVAIKGLGGYQLACDATNDAAVALLRRRKHRPHKPLAVMFRNLAVLKQFCRANEVEEAELQSAARPIVLLPRAFISGRTELAAALSPDTGAVGAFLPYTPLHHLLLQGFDALVMTSGNLPDEPIISDEQELPALLGGVADAALTHNRPITHKCDDSVLRLVNGQRQFMRRARGFAPNPIRIAPHSPQILAVGGELKNTFCLVRDGSAFVSQHVGDLRSFKTYEFFTREIAAWETLMRIEPEAVAYDLHPAYLSTKFAQKLSVPHKIGVQHHHAHIASVMAEHELHEPLIGVALDGTGFGTDGTIWGGEFLIADRLGFTRAAHFKAYPQPGGDQAVAQPWRMAAGILLAEGIDLSTEDQFAPEALGEIQKMIRAQFNAPLTSGAGRLFDAVAVLLGLCRTATYEAQPAIRLESIADPRETGRYPFEVKTQATPWTLDFGLTIRALIEDREQGVGLSVISAKFHNTVVAAVVQACRLLRGRHDLNSVALSGGVFQNALLLRRTIEALQTHYFTVFTNNLVPPNDGGLALGQAAVAAARLLQEKTGCSTNEVEACA